VTGDAAARDVVAYLLADWRRAFHLTTITQALDALGLGPDPALRAQVADVLLADPTMAPVPRRWGVPTLVLTNDEKLLGRALARADRPLTRSELAADLGADHDTVATGLAMLARCDLVTTTGEHSRLAAGWRQRLGPLGWHFHEVRPEQEAAFNVPCAIDFLLLVRHLYPDRRVAIRDACAQSAARIELLVSQGAITAITPPAALVFRGGG
jgi:hypothetical protein